MAEITKIAWTDATWNPWIGCKKVSSGCINCYMFRDAARFGTSPDIVRRASPQTFDNPIRWLRNKKLKVGSRVFTCSWSDWFIEKADEWRDDAWDVIRRTPDYIYLILTKRVLNIESRLPKDWGDGWDNVWLGITTEDQDMYDKRIDFFVDIPSKLRFISIEPMLGPINLYLERYSNKLHWIITGGESDRSRPREMKYIWPYDAMIQCKEYGIPFFHKQMGSYWAKWNGSLTWKGDDPLEWPQDIRIREFPNVDNANIQTPNRD